MSKEKFKKFIKEHKKGLIIGSCSIVGACALYVIGNKMKTKSINDKAFDDSWVADLLLDCLECVKVDGVDTYVPIMEDELYNIVGSPFYVKDPSGEKLLVKTVLAFGVKEN